MNGSWAWALAFSAASACALGACDRDKKDESMPSPAAAASSVAPSAPPPSAAQVVKYSVTATGKTSIDMPAPKEHIKCETTASAGDLRIDLTNLANSRGEIKVDLDTLKTHTFDDPAKDGKQTEHALTWLEIGDKASPEMKEKNRWATFAIRSIDGASATDITKVAAVPVEGGELRTVTLTAHGEFFMHGHKLNKDATLEVKLHYATGAPADSKPTSIDVASKTPLHVILADHDVKPRDSFGALAQGAFNLLGTKVAETADVTLDFHATPAP
jgi:hypothetical protein